MLTPEWTAIIVAVVSLVGTIFVALMSRGKLDKNEAVKLENRLTKLESTDGFTDDDRKCLYGLVAKVDILWGFFEKGLPDSLKQLETIRYDALLDVAKFGFQHIKAHLSIAEQEELITLVRQDFQEAKAGENGERMLRAGLYLVMLESELSNKTPEEACRGIIDVTT